MTQADAMREIRQLVRLVGKPEEFTVECDEMAKAVECQARQT